MTSGLAYYGADGGVVHSFREHFRNRWPGTNKCVVTDLDCVVRVYGDGMGGPRGRFVLIEMKYGQHTQVGGGQIATFSLMDELMRQADPQRERYRGMYLVRYIDDPEFTVVTVKAWDSVRFKQNSEELTFPTLDQFDDYLMSVLADDPTRLLNP